MTSFFMLILTRGDSLVGLISLVGDLLNLIGEWKLIAAGSDLVFFCNGFYMSSTDTLMYPLAVYYSASILRPNLLSLSSEFFPIDFSNVTSLSPLLSLRGTLKPNALLDF